MEFGRIGLAGQSSRKEFGSDDEAKSSHDKLIAEKLRKGYHQEGGGATQGRTPAPKTAKAKPEVRLEPEAKPAAEATKKPEPTRVIARPPAPSPVIRELPRRSLDLGPAD